MPEEPGLQYLDEEESDAQHVGDGPEAEREAPPSISGTTPEGPKTRRGGSRPLRDEEVETLARIVESLGGVVSGRLKLRVQRRQRGQGWKTLRPITIEDWMIEDGLDVPEVVGESYGNGFYRWQLRYSGKFVRKGDCNLEGYDEIPDSELLPPDSEDEEETVDLQELLGGFREELLEQLRPTPAEPRPADITLRAVEAAVKPLVELVGALRSEITALSAPKPAPSAAHTDPALQTLVGILSQQNMALFDLVAKSFAERGQSAPIPVLREDHFRHSLKNLKELVGIANELRGEAIGLQPHFIAEPDTDEPEDDDPEPPVDEELDIPEKPSFLDRAGKQVNEALERVVGNFVKYGEERLQSEVLSGAGDAQASVPEDGKFSGLPPAPAIPGFSAADRQSIEQLFEALDECVRRRITPEQFRDYIAPQLPTEALAVLRSGKVTAADIAQLAGFLGRPGIAERVEAPEVQRFLADVLALLEE